MPDDSKGTTCIRLPVRGSMEVDVLPATRDALPDAGFFETDRFWDVVFVYPLDESREADHGGVLAQQAHVG